MIQFLSMSRSITPIIRSQFIRMYGITTTAYEDSSRPVYSLKDALIPPNRPDKSVPTYFVLGNSLNKARFEEIPKDLPKEEIIKCFRGMVTLNEMDKILQETQRQGIITFYMTSFGEEAIHFGSAAAIKFEDIVFAQYREGGVLMYRGFTVQNCVDQCMGNRRDYGKGRQISNHWGSSKLNFQTISSPLGTQIPQAVGAAYSLKAAGPKKCVICYFGEGAASEGDFHAGMNFAATLHCPIIFFCRNNKWAISTPTLEQYRGDAIAGRGVAYGMYTIRVDGNDFFAVYNATREARRIAIEYCQPVLIEAMTYRIGPHSSSDDWKYRSTDEASNWIKDNNPIYRLADYMIAQRWWSEEDTQEQIASSRKEILAAINNAQKEKRPHLDHLFTDVYDTLSTELQMQKKELYDHLLLYPSQDLYPTSLSSSDL